MYDPEMESYCKDTVSDEICEAVDNGFKGIYNVLKAMKERGAVPVKQREIMHMLVWCCGSCGAVITDGDKFCRMCGKMVKWK